MMTSAGQSPTTNKDAEDDPNHPVSSFQSYYAEGDLLAKQGDYAKAIEAYSKALTLRPGEKNTLVLRSKCHLQMGDPQSALLDADEALKEDRDFFKGIFQKAEALYSKGDFEMALVFYHRGNKLRPELNEFRLGIQKASEAIDNSIGNPRDYKFKAPSGARLVVTLPTGQASSGNQNSLLATGTWVTSKQPPQPGTKESARAEKTVKRLLGELYSDKEYLERFFNDRDFESNPHPEIKHLVEGALKFLDNRTEFWRQQKPIYARKKEHSVALAREIDARNRLIIHEKLEEKQRRKETELFQKEYPKAAGGYRPGKRDTEREGGPVMVIKTPSPEGKPSQANALKNMQTSFNVIETELDQGQYEGALRKAKALLIQTNHIKSTPDSQTAISNLYDTIGRIYGHLGNPTEVVHYYKKELAHARQNKISGCESRALNQLARYFVKMNRYKEAISYYEELLAITPKKTIERACVLYDLGRCHLELKRPTEAIDYGQKSLDISEGAKDLKWALSATVLIAQAHTLLKHKDVAIEHYKIAGKYAEEIRDEGSLKAIQLAVEGLSRLNSRSKPKSANENRVTEQKSTMNNHPISV